MNFMNLLIQFILLILGFVLLIKGADWFVEGASKIADRFHIPQLVIGLTIVAFGTSAPEAAISITAAVSGNPDITIGNVVGSNIINVLIIIGITACILPLTIQKSTLYFELPYVVIISLILVFMGAFDHRIGRTDGIILWVIFIMFMVYLVLLSKKGNAVVDDIPESNQNEKLLKLIFITILGLVAIIVGSNITVDAATYIATEFGLSERFIGLTVVAFGTSLPELITSVTAGRKGKDDIAIGNIIGSNIFNVLFVVGTTAIITPVPFAQKFIIDGIVCIAAALLLFFCVMRDKKISRAGGLTMIVCYAGYFTYLLLR